MTAPMSVVPISPAVRPVVEVAGLVKSFGAPPDETLAIRSASFDVRRKEFVTLLGPSGCGKSTILMTLAGLETPTSGTVLLNGQPIRGPADGLGVVFQDATLLPWLSALDNILYPARIRKLPLDAVRPKAERMLARVGLEQFAGHKPGALSGGMRQRVALARALVYEPLLLLLDEPFSALDALTRDEMNLLLLQLWEQAQTTTILVTHSITEAILLSDRILVMSARPSSIIADIAVPFARPRPEEVLDHPEFIALTARLRALIGHARAAMRPAAGP